jgi:CubicO group peptidase (beta-lactamase class C family)
MVGLIRFLGSKPGGMSLPEIAALAILCCCCTMAAVRTKHFANLIPALALGTLLAGCAGAPRLARDLSDPEIGRVMRREGAVGLALATIEDGKVQRVRQFGQRNAALNLPMTDDTVLGARGLTQAAVAYLALLLADDGKLDLDAPLATLLPRPLPSYREKPFDYADLVDEPRWRSLTVRILLRHAGGFADHRWYEPDERLRIHFEPGSRYAHSSEGYALLQLVLERGLGLDIEREMQRRIFDRLGMRRTSLHWRPEYTTAMADGYGFDGATQPHVLYYRLRAAVSMDTTIADQARLWAGIVRGEGLSPGMRAALVEASLPVTSAHEVPALDPARAVWPQGLAAGLGVLVFRDRDGAAFFKASQDDYGANFVLCRAARRRCVVVLSNDVRAERVVPELVRLAIGETDVPWGWVYRWYEK